MYKSVVTLLAATLVLTACSPAVSEDVEPDPSVTPQEHEGGEDDNTQGADIVTVESRLTDIPLTVNIHPVQRWNELAVLTVEMEINGEVPNRDDRVLNSFDIDSTIGTPHNTRGHEFFTLIDRSAHEAIPIAFTDEEQGANTTDRLLFEDGENDPITSHMFYAAPEGDHVDVFLPLIGYVPDVSVEDVSKEELVANPATEGMGDLTLRTAGLEQYSVAHDRTSTLRAEGEEQTLTLAADVLFETGEHELTKKAKKVVTQAADDIRDLADGGEIHLVGHTDDVSSASFNQKLSERRANSVKAALEENLGSDYIFTAEGRGKTEPIADGTSADARAANRRVEIEFIATKQAESEEVNSLEALPKTEGTVIEDGSSLQISGAGIDYEFSIEEVNVLDDEYLQASFELEQISETNHPLLEIFSGIVDSWSHGRNIDTYALMSGAGNFTLLTQDEHVFPLDFEIPHEQNASDDELRRIIGTGAPTGSFVAGDVFRYDVVWPNTGSDTVVIDIPDVVRFVDVPVTK